jgi:putative transposase
MNMKRFTQEQIAYALRQAESGTPVVGIVRKRLVLERISYRWNNIMQGLVLANCDH